VLSRLSNVQGKGEEEAWRSPGRSVCLFACFCWFESISQSVKIVFQVSMQDALWAKPINYNCYNWIWEFVWNLIYLPLWH